MRRWIFAVIFFFLPAILCAQDTRIAYTGLQANVVINGSYNNYPSPGKTYVLNVQPNYSIQIFLSDLSGSGGSVTLTTNYTGNGNAPDYSNNTAQYAALNLLLQPTGTLQNINTFSTTAGTTSVLSSQITSASQIAITFRSNSGATDTFNLIVVLTPNGLLGTSNVQGVVANGAAANGVLPVMMGGMDASNTARFIRVDSCSGSGLPECIEINENLTTITSLLSNGLTGAETFNSSGGTQNGPLAVDIYDAASQIFHSAAAGTFNITTAGTQRTNLKRIMVNTGAAGSLAVWTNACTTGTLLSSINTASSFLYEYDAQLSTGLCVIQVGTADISVVYR